MIANVTRFVNGMVMVFDENGQQLHEYQGRWEDCRAAILRDKPADVRVDDPIEWFPGQTAALAKQ